jgi:pimeloyl-ACP methyl ester carboxylesterase
VPEYPVETHKITTEDGYILTVFRIQKKGTKIVNGKPPVFLQHGINDTAFFAFVNDRSKAIGPMLADNGFDVWIGNSRGNVFSRAHTTLDIHKKEFWEYSFMQMGQYDVPANLKYIHYKTGQKVIYIGHSQGTSQMFAALGDSAVRPKVVPYLDRFYALAPVVYLVKFFVFDECY